MGISSRGISLVDRNGWSHSNSLPPIWNLTNRLSSLRRLLPSALAIFTPQTHTLPQRRTASTRIEMEQTLHVLIEQDMSFPLQDILAM